jgi:hypothetical protein
MGTDYNAKKGEPTMRIFLSSVILIMGLSFSTLAYADQQFPTDKPVGGAKWLHCVHDQPAT